MKIEAKKFGEFLTSRPAGREAYLVIQSYFKTDNPNEDIEVDFSGVKVLGPSWADEVIRPLREKLGKRLVLSHTANPSVAESLKIIE